MRQPILGTFDDPGPEGPRPLPNVRRNSGRYYSGSDPKLMRLTGDYVFKLNRDTYARASAGYLERQFGGVSGEVLWMPPEQSWGLGLEINQVWQRDFEGLGFHDYDVTTGHASVYWQTGYKGFEVQIDAGRYLAGDWGATFTLTRRFANGWAVGAFATKTDVSAEDFGEGSFDKGIVLSIPLRWATPFETAADHRRRPARRSRATAARSSTSRTGSIRPCATYDRSLERNWGAFWQ